MFSTATTSDTRPDEPAEPLTASHSVFVETPRKQRCTKGFFFTIFFKFLFNLLINGVLWFVIDMLTSNYF